jgi:inner membrane protein
MPTIFTHAAAALSIGSVMLPRRVGATVWAAGVFCAVVPDADVLAFHFGASYDDMLGHRGLTHSVLFAAVLAFALMLMQRRGFEHRGRITGHLFICAASHGILDAFTNGGRGVAFFAPFSAERYFFPFTPIEVSPIGAAFFSARGWHVLESELSWVWLPAAVVAALGWSLRLRHAR